MQAVKLCTNKILPEVLNWRCQTTQVDLYNGRKPVVVVAVHQTPISITLPYSLKKKET